MKRNRRGTNGLLVVLVVSALLLSTGVEAPSASAKSAPANQVLEWNQIFIDTLIAGHPAQNGAAATVLLDQFRRGAQTFTLTTTGQPDRAYRSIAQARADGNDARVWGGMHYPSTVEISDGVGEAIANHVNRHVKRGSIRVD
jgi:hypothetical protein